MEIIGPRQLCKQVRSWLLYSPINMNHLSNPLLTSGLGAERSHDKQNRTASKAAIS
jgi:hypothetical protein